MNLRRHTQRGWHVGSRHAAVAGFMRDRRMRTRSIRRRCPPGRFTTAEHGANAFSVPVAMLDKEQAEAFAKGKEQFNEAWVVAPEPGGVWGLGPTFNEDRCAHCHANNGRAKAPDNGQEAELGLLVRLEHSRVRPRKAGPNPHPAYGDQLQNRGIPDRVPAEGQRDRSPTRARGELRRRREGRPCACRQSSSRICSSASWARTS